MSFFDYFKNSPLVSWNFDSVEDTYEIVKKEKPYDYDNLKNNLNQRINDLIKPVVFEMGMKFNLGGEKDKERLVATDKPLGIFDFSLASNGLYRVPEYYSIHLERENPKKFEALGLHAGVIPPNLVQSRVINGVKNFFYQDGEKEYHVTQRQKGATALEQGDSKAKLKFATKNKKVYLNFRRHGGKVNYCEIYTLYYYTSMGSPWQYNMRHLPVLLLAEYFEKTGIKTRLYPTRFVKVGNAVLSSAFRKYDDKTGLELPQYVIAKDLRNVSSVNDFLIVQPLMVKDFGKEIDYFDFFAISDIDNTIYETLAIEAFNKEFINPGFQPFGNPDWEQIQYRTGFERYKNKYSQYVKLGLWKSKEVQPEAQLFFHSMSIKRRFNSFWREMTNELSGIQSFNELTYNKGKYHFEKEVLEFSPEVREFFQWWMRLCALRLKTQMEIINSKTPRKAMKEAADEVMSFAEEINNSLKKYEEKYNNLAKNAPTPQERDNAVVLQDLVEKLKEYRNEIYYYEDMVPYNSLSPDVPQPKLFISAIINESTVFATGEFFPTPKEQVEKRLEFADYLFEELNYL